MYALTRSAPAENDHRLASSLASDAGALSASWANDRVEDIAAKVAIDAKAIIVFFIVLGFYEVRLLCLR